MSFGASMAGFASGLSGGIGLGQKLSDLIQEDQIAKVRAQGIAEAKAAQAASTPQVTDNGDANNLSSNPQSSQDPNAAPQPVNTSLTAAIQGAQDTQAVPDADARAAGIKTYAVQAPDAPQSTDQLSSTPLASAAPDAAPDPASAAPSNLDAAAKSGLAPLTPPKRFNVDGKEFDTAEDAAAYVKKSTPPLASFFKTTLIPKMTDALIAQGKPDQAVAWQKYADDQDNQEHMKTWSKAVQLAQFGDFNGSAEQLMKLHPHFDDGYDLLAAKATKGPDGQDGFTMSVRAPDGSTQQMYQDAKTITQLGLSQLSPIEMFKKKYEAQNRADEMAAKETIDQANDKRTADRQLNNAVVRDTAAEQRQQERLKADAAKQKAAQAAAAARDEQKAKEKSAQIDQAGAIRAKADAAKIAAQGQYRKAVSPQEREAMVITHLSSDPMFNMLSAADKQKRVAETLALLPKPGPAPAQAPVANPLLNGVQTSATPAQSSAPAGKMAVPVFNPTTGKIETVYR